MCFDQFFFSVAAIILTVPSATSWRAWGTRTRTCRRRKGQICWNLYLVSVFSAWSFLCHKFCSFIAKSLTVSTFRYRASHSYKQNTFKCLFFNFHHNKDKLFLPQQNYILVSSMAAKLCWNTPGLAKSLLRLGNGYWFTLFVML